jgi:hypothetical protein
MAAPTGIGHDLSLGPCSSPTPAAHRSISAYQTAQHELLDTVFGRHIQRGLLERLRQFRGNERGDALLLGDLVAGLRVGHEGDRHLGGALGKGAHAI